MVLRLSVTPLKSQVETLTSCPILVMVCLTFLVALAGPLLIAARDGQAAVEEALELIIEELRIICFCTGARTIQELRQVRVLPR